MTLQEAEVRKLRMDALKLREEAAASRFSRRKLVLGLQLWVGGFSVVIAALAFARAVGLFPVVVQVIPAG